ncbi:MAG TPA: hypothetical protein VIA18_16510 [Polyangia bacterium]|nr:hypothetical protein [Polyangia bacterium]
MSRAWCSGVVLFALVSGCSNNVKISNVDSGVVGADDMSDHVGISTDLAGADLFSNGTGGPLPPPGGAETGPFATFTKQFATAACKRYERCGFVAASEDASCQAEQTLSITSPPPYTPDDGITAGRATLNTTVTAACLAAIGAGGCGLADDYAIQNACTGVLKGTVANGVGCRGSFECMTGFCLVPGDGCAGTCKAFATAGFSCADSVCDNNSYCDPDTAVCVAKGSSTLPCSATQPCQPGLVCKGEAADGTGGTCGAVVKSGGDCTASTDCDVGLYCSVSTGTAKCTALLQSGASCTDFDACGQSLDCVGLTVASGTNVGAPGKCGGWIDIAATCDPTTTETGCTFDATCDAGSKKCTAIGTAGYACQTSNDCHIGLYCNANTVCAAEVPYGDACNTNDGATDQCLSGSCDATSSACLTYCP